MTISVEEIAASLKGRKTGKNSWTVKCPAHEDKRPSCSLTEKDGKILVHCWAGCTQEAVIGALRDLGLWHQARRRDDIVTPIETKMPQPIFWPEAIYYMEQLVFLASEVDQGCTQGMVNAYLDQAADISYNAVMRVSAVLTHASQAAHIFVTRWHSQRLLDALHEARPW